MRRVKHIGGRSVAGDESKVLIAVPFFPGETITNIAIDAYFGSGTSSAIDQPGELNWYGLTIPWALVFATQMMVGGLVPDPMASVDDIDELYERYLRSANLGAAKRFGGDAEDDVELTEGEAGHDQQELIDSGPINVHQFFTREVLMRPIAAEGNTIIRFGDFFNANTGHIPSPKGGGMMLFGCVRFDMDAETNFNIELDDATSREAIGLLIAGDYTKIKAKIEGDASSAGDYLRTVLFGGDAFIEADTLKEPAGKAIVKAVISIDGPLSREH